MDKSSTHGEVEAQGARAFIKKWAFDHNYNWPHDEPSERTFEGTQVIELMEAYAASEREERKKAEQELTKAHELLRRALKCANSAEWEEECEAFLSAVKGKND